MSSTSAGGESGEVTRLLADWRGGRAGALDELVPLVYGELHTLAASYLRRERPEHTLQPTALVHEAFLRLVDQRTATWQNRAHFFGIAAQAMRRILADHARRHRTQKRGGGHSVPLPDDLPAPDDRAMDIAFVDEALERLAALDERQARVVELRFFGGLTIDETAEVLGVSSPTVKRDWVLARAWLQRELERDAG